jgi:Catalase
MSGSAASPTVVAQLVETMRALAGRHLGFRPVHAKGLVCSGTFRGSASARAVSRAPHLQGQAVPTVMRFSNSSGNPDVHDGIANARAGQAPLRAWPVLFACDDAAWSPSVSSSANPPPPGKKLLAP